MVAPRCRIASGVIVFAACWWCASGYGETPNDLHDPTRPIDTAPAVAVTPVPAEQSSLQLSGIKIEHGRRLAVINNLVVPLHGQIAGARVVDIQTGYVVLEQSGGRQTLRLFPAGMRKQPARAKLK